MVKILTVRPKDWQIVKSVRLAALADSPQAFCEKLEVLQCWPDQAWRERTRLNAAGDSSTCVLAYAGGNAVGMAAGLLDQGDKKKVHLVALWVAPEHRGSGIAGALLEAVKSWARSAGARELLAQILPNNGRALGFYTRAGFKAPAEISPHISFRMAEDVVMSLKLDA